MITHVVLFRFDDPGHAQEAVARIRAMVGRVPVLRSLQAGLNVVPSERAYDVGLVATFDSLDDLQVYADHPEHVPVARWIRERATSIVAADFDPA